MGTCPAVISSGPWLAHLERERQRERDRDRERQRQRETERERETETERDIWGEEREQIHVNNIVVYNC